MNIEKFLYGWDVENKFLINLIGENNSNKMTCIYQYLDGTKVQKIEKYKPFIFVKDLRKCGIDLYKNKSKDTINRYIKEFGISFKKLKTYNHERLENGYSTIVYGNSLNAIKMFYANGGVTIGYNDPHKLSNILKLEEMFLIQKGIRLFKGFEKYDDLHKLTFDIETTGLNKADKRIFMIGCRDNKGFRKIIGVNKKDDDEEEKRIIIEFFKLYTTLKPSIINHYNGENFDWDFILGRCEILGIDLDRKMFTNDGYQTSFYKIQTTLTNKTRIYQRENATLKVGNETQRYTKTHIYGINNIDIIHAAKRTQAINSDIKNVRLKYICKFEKIAKPNRMYVEGSEIYTIWSEDKNYIINPENNIYKLIPEKYQNKDLKYLDGIKNTTTKKDEIIEYFKFKSEDDINKLNLIKGSQIVEEYLIDDLIETNEVDKKYNESSFLLAQMIPTTFERICTMGNAAVWKLIMTAWSYENELAIPIADQKEDFSGGLARAFYLGLSENLGKIDFAGLYPTIQLTYDAFPSSDVTNVLKKLLLYLLTTRNSYKKLANDNTISEELQSFYKTKQLPLKILNNSLFGALGSGESFPWGESMLASRITCIGRLHLRKLIRFFVNYNYNPILAVTDGVNFEIPKQVKRDINGKKLKDFVDINTLKYVVDGKEYIGHDAIVEKYNCEIVKYNINEGRFIQVDNDGMFQSSLTLSRINYALKFPDEFNENGEITKLGKIKLTGNTIKSKGMPEYIEGFIDKAMNLILNNKPEEFIEYYYEYLEKIFYKQIPLKQIASKSKVKSTLKQYMNRGNNKNGNPLPKQAHMELCIANNVEFELGTVIYYVNIGTAKSHGDTKMLKNKKTGEEYLSSYMIDQKSLDENPNLMGDYNVKKYVDAFNKRVEKLLLGFDDNIINNLIKDNPEKREFFTKEELKFIKKPHDSIKDFMNLEVLELKHWNDSGYDPSVIYNGYQLSEDTNLNGVEEYKITLNKINNNLNNFKLDKPIKAIYDNYGINDYVLKKTKDKYSIHQVDENEYLLDITKQTLN